MISRGSSWAARNAPIETSQAAAQSGRPRRTPATATTAATSAHTPAQTAMIEARVESLTCQSSIAHHMAVVVLGILAPAEEHRSEHPCPHGNAHPAPRYREDCFL